MMTGRGAAGRMVPAAGIAFALFVLVWLAIPAGAVIRLDTAILRALRVAGHPGLPVGPRWLEPTLRDITALGGGRILTLLTILATLMFVVRRAWASAIFLPLATLSGAMIAQAIKYLVGRIRPEVVPHLVDESSFSFPSAHATNSSLVFLTLALLATRLEADRATRRATIGIAILMTLLVGLSRLYLGVHWPTDVFGGWCFGTGWALLCCAVARRWLPREGGRA